MNTANYELLKLAQEIAKIGSWEVDIRSSNVFWSETTYKIHEVSPETKIRLEDGINFYIEEHRPIIQKHVEEGIQSGKPWDVELQIRTTTGKVKWVRAIGRAVFKNGELIKLEGVFQDINTMKSHQLKLSSLVERHNLAMSASQFGIWDWDISNNVLNWDDRMLEVYGISPDKFSSSYEAWSKSLHPDDKDKVERDLELALKEGKKFNSDFRIITNKGEVRYIGTISKIINDENGQAKRMIGMNWDKTQEILDREQLIKLNEELVQFAYRTSHDLKSPLNAIKSITAIALEDLQNKDYKQVETDLLRVDQQIDRLTKLIQDMMDLTKIDNLEPHFAPIDFKNLIERIKKNQNFNILKENIEFETKIERDLFIYSDKIRLTSILSNLIDNSIKYSDPSKENRYIRINAYSKNDQTYIEVEDNGVGIPTEQHQHVFKMFRRFYQKKDGTGLGLYMIKKNVELLKGTISFESSVEGTTFRMKFPLRKKWMAVG